MYPIGNYCLLRAPDHFKAWVRILIVVLSIAMIPQAAESAPTRARPAIPPGKNNWTPPATAAAAAITTQDLNSGLTPADLVTALLGPGVAVSNVTFTGANTAAGKFAGGTGIIGFESGIMLSSGDIAFVPGPNTQDDVSGVNAGFGDPDLDGLIPGYTTFDACLLEFDFQCTGTQVIQFQYVFTSEEYNEWVNSPFNDVFGFFLNGVNIALVPGSAGTPVSINNVNCDNPYNPPAGSFCSLFINNDCSDIPPGTFPCTGARDIQMDGMIVILTATGTLSPGVNHIKLALADAGDQVLDSNVFIRAQSFTCGEPTGACCNTGTQSCTDNVTQFNCQGSGMNWSVGLTCNQLDPPCTTVADPAGTDCANPISINSLPFVETNTTSDKGNDYTNTCLGDYDNGHDILYELTMTSTQCVDITVTGATPNDNWIGVALDSACPPNTVCIAQGTSQANVATISNLTLSPGTYYLMIDRWPVADESLDFTLSITDCSGAPTGACCNSATQVCTDDVLEVNCQGLDDTWSVGVACGDLVPPCAPEVDPIGQDCEFPIFVPSIPFDDVNTTSDKKEDYSSSCLGVYDDGDDIIYQITLTNTHCVDVTVAGATAIDHSIGVVLDDFCPPDLDCLAQATTTGTVATISHLLLDPGMYYLMIDRQPDDEGFAVLNFRLTIAECPAASGACCLPGGECAQVTEADCMSAGGLTWTTDTPCSPNPCEVLTLTCPGDITVPPDVGHCTAVVAYPDPAVTPAGTPVSCEPPSGSVFPPGATTVLCTASNESGTVDCSFQVTVIDDPPACTDGDVCTTDECVNGVCEHQPIAGCCNTDAECVDEDLCTTDLCVNHACVHEVIPGCCHTDLECQDADACTTDLCIDGLCEHPPIAGCCNADTECVDEDVCTTDLCVNHACGHEVISGCCHTDLECQDADACTTDLCIGSVCEHPPIAGCCNTDAECVDEDQCTDDLCVNHLCQHNPVSGCCLVDSDCLDGDDCTADTCVNHACEHVAVTGCCHVDGDCVDGDACTLDRCVDNTCENVVIGDCCHSDADCGDSDGCTIDRCVEGVCDHEALPGCCNTDAECDDGVACTIDQCLQHVCEHTADHAFCGDGLFCNGPEVCHVTLGCQPGAAPDCDDGDPCTVDSCDEAADGCKHVAQDDDGDDVCDAEDECRDSILTPTIVIDSCDSKVPNQLFDDGCTMSDEIAECALAAQTHGMFVRCVTHLTNGWRNAGLISSQQRSRIQRCAAHANIPPR